jgi:type II secretory pathway component PulF
MNAEMTFQPMLGQIFDEAFRLTFLDALARFFAAFLSFLLLTGCIGGMVYLIHFFFTLPLRRAERARLFLDLIDGALKRGQSIEEMVLSVAQCRDRTAGVRFHLLAAHVEGGMKFVEALKRVPRFLPPQIVAVLCAGEKLGDLKKMLPACREVLRDRPAAVRSALHYLILVVLLFSPFFIFVVMFTMVFVVPKFKEVAAGMGVQVWPLAQFVFDAVPEIILLEVLITLLLAFIVLFYVGGPQFVRWFQFHGLPFVDWVAWKVPWKQKRLQRTFSAMLSVLLDGGVPDAEAVRLAGDCTVNEICRLRARRVVAMLEKGVKLDEAVHTFDDTGEFHWRLTNATHAHGGFMNALLGWHEALEAKAFQQEEATAQMVTTGLVILNGGLVALIVTAMFGLLIMVLKGVLDAT